ncbi:hypothetical protein M1437_04840 [Patescibacteria group bacterium]|nr:hypothetical protein [Patescibacteria group bacterium]
MIYWEVKKIGEDRKQGEKYWISWDICKAKSIAVECTPKGTIHVNAGLFGGSSIPERTWRNNVNIFDVALEKAFKHPRTFHFTGGYVEEHSDPGS